MDSSPSIPLTIKTPQELRELKKTELQSVCDSIRKFIIESVAYEGKGHLGASLGVVELTVAIHYTFNTPWDLLVWDVGHQAYAHKIITERKHLFKSNRKLNGISGFPCREESIYDNFGTGHSSTSISAILGMAVASKLSKKNKQHICVIGDASISSGMALEALNHASATQANILVILNDNAIGIDPNIGGIHQYFQEIKNSEYQTDNHSKLTDIFRFKHLGVVDGHDLNELIHALEISKQEKGLKFLHVKTVKGKGLLEAEKKQTIYHAPGKFDPQTGKQIISPQKNTKYQDIFGKTLEELAYCNDKIIAITPAMPTGSGLNNFMKKFPERCFDTGIAEQHAVTFAGGMAIQDYIPYVVIYSTFLQRAYDQIIHDIALQNLAVVFCIDRAGIVGEDGATHHGIFDISYLNCIPNLHIFAPKDGIELRQLLFFTSKGLDYPVSIRYPRGYSNIEKWQINFNPKYTPYKIQKLRKGQKTAIISTGDTRNIIDNTIKILKEKNTNKLPSWYHITCIKPLDQENIRKILENYQYIITIEEGSKIGGFGSRILQITNTLELENNPKIRIVGIEDIFLKHGKTEELLEQTQLNSNYLSELILNFSI